jgi:hypothetical protein
MSSGALTGARSWRLVEFRRNLAQTDQCVIAYTISLAPIRMAMDAAFSG